jgi:hypothetical protein
MLQLNITHKGDKVYACRIVPGKKFRGENLGDLDINGRALLKLMLKGLFDSVSRLYLPLYKM